MSSIYMIGLIIITKPGSVKQVYDIPWWREFYDVVEEFNRKYGMNLGCGFAHRITVDKPPQDIFDEVSIGYIKKSHLIIDILSIGSPGGTLIAAKEVCTLWKVDEHSWHMLIFRNDEIATNLSRFIEQKFNVTIEQVQQTSEFIKNRARTSGLCRVITTR